MDNGFYFDLWCLLVIGCGVLLWRAVRWVRRRRRRAWWR